MQKTNSPIKTLAIDLNKKQIHMLQSTFGHELTIDILSQVSPESLEAYLSKNSVSALWLNHQGSYIFDFFETEALSSYKNLAKILLLDEKLRKKDMEAALDFDVQKIVKAPYTANKIYKALVDALESQSLHEDLACMTREIILERELLHRKNSLLEFLVDFLEKTGKSIQIEEILKNAYAALKNSFPTKVIHAILWNQNQEKRESFSVFINSEQNSKTAKAWNATIKKYIASHLSERENGEETICYYTTEDQIEVNPNINALTFVPLIYNAKQFGCLIFHFENNFSMGKDQATAFNLALQHLTLSLYNAQKILQLQYNSDYDALSTVHSRRFFDNCLVKEYDLHMRYATPLSLIMVDIDHFKKVNDEYGHVCGDFILKQLGSLLKKETRASDCCARYGGEEFAIILPHTEEQEAILLAERIRKKLAKQCYEYEGKKISVSASFGVSTAKQTSSLLLVEEADSALYQAKKAGRNCVYSQEGKKVSGL